MKKVLLYVITLMLFAVALPQHLVFAEATPLSSDVFITASVSLSASGTTIFSANVRHPCTISVSRCTLQKQENGRWVYAASLTPPLSKTNTSVYSAVKDYSASMAHGTTYRIVATFEADGDTITKTSNSMTY